MPFTQLLFEKIERIGRITLNRPRYRNAQSTILLKELDRAFEEAAEDDEIKVVILAGAGDHFSAGHDLGTPDERENPVIKGRRNLEVRYIEIKMMDRAKGTHSLSPRSPRSCLHIRLERFASRPPAVLVSIAA